MKEKNQVYLQTHNIFHQFKINPEQTGALKYLSFLLYFAVPESSCFSFLRFINLSSEQASTMMQNGLTYRLDFIDCTFQIRNLGRLINY